MGTTAVLTLNACAPRRCRSRHAGTSRRNVFLSSKEEVELDEAISNSPEKGQGELSTIVEDSEVVEPCMFGEGVYFSVFYCLCFEMDIYTYMSEDQVQE